MGLLDKVTAKKSSTTKTKKAASKKADSPNTVAVNQMHVLLRPLLSEKTTKQEAMGQYSFEVAPSANKHQIKHAVHAIYGVMPEKVRVMNLDGKKYRTRYGQASRKQRKKAIVCLAKGKTIEIHEGV